MDSGEATVGEFVVVTDQKRKLFERGFAGAINLDHVVEQTEHSTIEVELEVLHGSSLQTFE
jgi:hypothetical protein